MEGITQNLLNVILAIGGHEAIKIFCDSNLGSIVHVTLVNSNLTGTGDNFQEAFANALRQKHEIYDV
jgi:hypothetical protein